MIRASIQNPYAVIVACIFVALAGVTAARTLPLQLRPTVEPAEVQVTTAYPGAAPAEVEDQITRRIEDQLTSVSGMRELVSTSGSGRSTITLKFEDGVDRNVAMIDVLNKLGGVQGLPGDADPPEATATTSDQQSPMMWVAVQGIRDAAGNVTPLPVQELRQAVDDAIAPRLRRVEGVAGMIIAGADKREVHLLANLDAAAARGIPISELLAALPRHDVNSRGGPLWSGKREYTLRTLGRPATLNEVANVVLRRDGQGVVHLGDIATPTIESAIGQTTMRLNGIPGISLGIQRQTGANVPTTADGVESALEELRHTFAISGVPIDFTVLYSETTYIDDALAGAVSDSLLGVALAGAALLIALRSPRAVVVVAAAQPLAVLCVFPVLWWLGRSLNIITLAGLAFGVGITIDNAIVVVENIHRHRERGASVPDAAWAGTREVAGAMVAATMTNVCVFAPVIFLGGEAGQIFRDLAIGISVAAVGSLIAVLTVVPAAAAWLGTGAVTTVSGGGWLGRLYGRIIDAITRHAWVRILVLLAAISVSGLGVLAVPAPSYLPEGNRNLILTLARALPGTSSEAAGELLAPLEQSLLADPRVDRTFVVLSSRFSAVGMTLTAEHTPPAKFSAFLGELRGRVATVPGFRFLFPIRASIFQDPGRQFEVSVSGPDLGELTRLAAKLQANLRTLPGVVSVRSNFEAGNPEIQVLPDRIALATLGITPQEVANAVEVAVGGRRVGTYLDEGRELDVVLIGEDRYRHDAGALKALYIRPGVPLDAVADVVEVLGPVSIPHLDQARAITLTVNLGEGAALGAALQACETTVLDPLRAGLPAGYLMATGGTADRLSETFRGLQSSFGYALVLIYLLLVALYKSWSQPLVILTAVPLGVCGALLALAAAHLVAKVEFDMVAMLGTILLAGVVVNTSILIVSQAEEFLAQGVRPRDALREAAASRLRPILMSVVTSVIGMLPLAAGQGSGSELYRGLGVIMVGGMVLSTLAVPLVVPALLAMRAKWRG
ncbi:MAG: efflux RND transporter permease subunit [Myxococcales bacterium]|nr:efflux RND transporter permease subunit [Myxococcales bacterium]